MINMNNKIRKNITNVIFALMFLIIFINISNATTFIIHPKIYYNSSNNTLSISYSISNYTTTLQHLNFNASDKFIFKNSTYDITTKSSLSSNTFKVLNIIAPKLNIQKNTKKETIDIGSKPFELFGSEISQQTSTELFITLSNFDIIPPKKPLIDFGVITPTNTILTLNTIKTSPLINILGTILPFKKLNKLISLTYNQIYTNTNLNLTIIAPKYPSHKIKYLNISSSVGNTIISGNIIENNFTLFYNIKKLQPTLNNLKKFMNNITNNCKTTMTNDNYTICLIPNTKSKTKTYNLLSICGGLSLKNGSLLSFGQCFQQFAQESNQTAMNLNNTLTAEKTYTQKLETDLQIYKTGQQDYSQISTLIVDFATFFIIIASIILLLYIWYDGKKRRDVKNVK